MHINLKVLNLCSNLVSDLSALAGFTRLTSMRNGSTPGIEFFTDFAGLPQLVGIAGSWEQLEYQIYRRWGG